MMHYDSDNDNDSLSSLSSNRRDCEIPEGMMVAGIVGALVSVMLSAPIIAIGFVGMWSAGAVAHYADGSSCVPASDRED